MSAISINSKSRMRLTSFDGSAAVGLNGPGAEIVGVEGGGGRGGTAVDTVDAAAASRFSPELLPAEGEKMGSLGSDEVTVVTMGPV